MTRSFHIQTFGCQMNVHDAEALAGLLERSGLRRVSEHTEADVVLIETCSVRQHAEDKVWSLLGRLAQRKEHYPEMTIGVCTVSCSPRMSDINAMARRFAAASCSGE